MQFLPLIVIIRISHSKLNCGAKGLLLLINLSKMLSLKTSYTVGVQEYIKDLPLDCAYPQHKMSGVHLSIPIDVVRDSVYTGIADPRIRDIDPISGLRI